MVDVGGDFGEFFVYFLRIGIGLEDSRKSFTSFLVSTLEEEPARRFGEDDETNNEDLKQRNVVSLLCIETKINGIFWLTAPQMN